MGCRRTTGHTPLTLINTRFQPGDPEGCAPFSQPFYNGFLRPFPFRFNRPRPEASPTLINTRFQPGVRERQRSSRTVLTVFLRTLRPGQMRATVIDYLEETTRSPPVPQKLSRTY